jgi:hypothetical protein
MDNNIVFSYKHLFLFFLLLLFFNGSKAQIMLDKGRVEINDIILLESAELPGSYYYVPTTFRLINSEEGQPKGQVLKYTGVSVSSEQGGILMVQLDYSLPDDQLADLHKKLSRIRPKARIAGPLPLSENLEDHQFSFDAVPVEMEQFSLMNGHELVVTGKLDKTGALLMSTLIDRGYPTFGLYSTTFSGLAHQTVRLPRDEVLKVLFPFCFQEGHPFALDSLQLHPARWEQLKSSTSEELWKEALRSLVESRLEGFTEWVTADKENRTQNFRSLLDRSFLEADHLEWDLRFLRDTSISLFATFPATDFHAEGYNTDIREFSERSLWVGYDLDMGKMIDENILKRFEFELYKDYESADLMDWVYKKEVKFFKKYFDHRESGFNVPYAMQGESSDLNYYYRFKFYYLEGGALREIQSDWKMVDFVALSVISPLELRTIEYDIDPEIFKETGVEYIQIDFFSEEGQFLKRVFLDLEKMEDFYNTLSLLFDREKSGVGYQYSLTYFLKDGRIQQTDGRVKSTDSYLYLFYSGE